MAYTDVDPHALGATRTCRRQTARWLAGVAIAVLCATTTVGAKRNDDRVVLLNGDRLVGEVKQLSQGELHFKPGWVLDTFHIDWAQVQEVVSLDHFRVETRDGRRLTGTIARFPDGRFTVQDAAGATVTVRWSDVMGILPVETSVWAQLTGQISSGYSFTSADSQTQFTASGSLGYVADRYAFDLTGSSSVSSHSDEDNGGTSTVRNTADLMNEFPVGRQWFAVGLLGFLNSDEQDLDLRTTAGGGIGRWLARTRHTRLTMFGGLVYTHEQYSGTSDTGDPDMHDTNNLEGVVSVVYRFHRFKTADIQSNFTVYPSLTTLGRVRLNVAPTLNIELVRNLYWNFTLYENYDSHPPVNANKNDFGITNSIGWKF